MIILKKLSKHYGKNVIIKELDLEIPTTGLTCITGQSGAGKTTLLNPLLEQLVLVATIMTHRLNYGKFAVGLVTCSRTTA